MSLELQIKALTESVTILNESISRLQPNAFFIEEQPKDNLIVEHEKAGDIIENNKQSIMELDEPKILTHDDLKDICLIKVRSDTSNKAKIKSLLGEYGATKAGDVPHNKIEEVINKIEAM